MQVLQGPAPNRHNQRPTESQQNQFVAIQDKIQHQSSTTLL